MGDKNFYIGLPEKLGAMLSNDFLLNEEFFEFIGDVLIESCLLRTFVSIERKNSFWAMQIKVDGSLSTVCDRCGDNLKMSIQGEELYFLKVKERNKHSQNENVIFISSKKKDFNLKPILQEACFLMLPVTRKHKLENCNQSVVSRLESSKKSPRGQVISSKILKDLKNKLKKK
tara:strand:- start:165 stop:683 length:519 start_codon:yes stop_codon:yes gene_type:complete